MAVNLTLPLPLTVKLDIVCVKTDLLLSCCLYAQADTRVKPTAVLGPLKLLARSEMSMLQRHHTNRPNTLAGSRVASHLIKVSQSVSKQASK